MKILSMTATFGKLDNQTLTLNEGLNVQHAPNEWGKSTWCAFITAMLYGIETGQRSSKAVTIPDKERYSPWSGKPMAGRMDILWNDRKITLERSTKGRSIFGNFRAYETDSGLPVDELTADNCGLTLLGVEKNVFTRAGFLKLTDMPITDDQALRRRLNALVTTGDESGASDLLAKKLHDLKNKCRHNKTGELPKAEAQRDALQNKLHQVQTAKLQIDDIQRRITAAEEELRLLENHKTFLAYDKAKEDQTRVAEAKAKHQAALEALRAMEAQCAALPSPEFAKTKLQQAEALQNRWSALQQKTLPQIPETPAAFSGMDETQIVQKVTADKNAYDALQAPVSPLLLILAALSLAAAVVLAFVLLPVAAVPLVLAVILTVLHFSKKKKNSQAIAQICSRYGSLAPERWVSTAEQYAKTRQDYQDTAREYNREKAALEEETLAVTGGKSIGDLVKEQRQTEAMWDALNDVKRAAEQAGLHAQTLASVVKDLPAPQGEDTLTLSEEITEAKLRETDRQHRNLQQLLGQYMGQLETLGSEETINRELGAVLQRIEKLEQMYTALVLAEETLTAASQELQRRFAPRITEKTRDLFEKLTGGRYNQLILEQNLSLRIAAQGEATLESAAWRSDGTVDQLYLALRLAVAQELTPEAPLVLDDALVRFDDTRLALAMDILKEESKQKQVILFSCHSREKKFE